MKRTSLKRKGKLNKVRKTSRAKLCKQLDDLTREILYAYWGKRCVMCSSESQVGVGHVFSRKHLATRWDVRPAGNCYPQCWPCNFRHVRDQYPYFRWFMDMYGMDAFEELRVRHTQTTHYKTSDLETMIEEYKVLLERVRGGESL